MAETIWREKNEQSDPMPEGLMLVEVETKSDSDFKIVYLDDDGQSLVVPETDEVWTDWLWAAVTRYAMLDEILEK